VLPAVAPLDSQSFRLMLAGLFSPCEDQGAIEEYRSFGVRIAGLLARHFGPSLDALTKWDRIGTAITSACAKSPQGDPDLLLSAALEHVKAELSVAANPEFSALLTELREKTPTWREGLVNYLQTTLYAVLVFARTKHVAARDERQVERARRKSDDTISSFSLGEEKEIQ